MGVCNYLDIFRKKTNELFQGFKYIRVYLNDLLVLTTGKCTNQLTHLEKITYKITGKIAKI